MRSAALYIRVSTDEQTEYSPAAQRKTLLDYAAKNNYVVSHKHIFVDEGYSGKKAEKRPAFMRMIGLAKSKDKPFDIILVHKFDRFARNREDSVVYKSMLRKECGVKVISVTESLDGDDKMSVIIEAILEAMAEYYSINLAEEVKKGMTEKARRGGYQTTPPLGYTVTDNRLSICEEESQYIRYIFEQYVYRGCSPYQIAKSLNGMGIKSKRGNYMDARGIQYILQNPVYTGMVRWTPTQKVRRNFNHPDTIIAKGEHEPIISENLFNEAKRINDARQSLYAASGKREVRTAPERRHWLSGFVRCSACGSSLIVASRLKYPSLQCSAYSKGQCPVSHSATVKRIESALFKELSGALEGVSAPFTPKSTGEGKSNCEAALLNTQLSKIEDRIKKANYAYLSQIYTPEEFREQKSILESQKTAVLRVLKDLKEARPESPKPSRNPSSLTDILFTNPDESAGTHITDLNLKQRALRAVIEKIVYDKAAETLEVYYIDPLS